MGFDAPVVAAIASVLATLAGALFSTLATRRRAAQRVDHEVSVRQVSEELKDKLEQQRAAQQEAEERVREALRAAQQRVEELQTAQHETEEQVREAQQAAQQRAEELQAAQEEAEEQVDQAQQNAQQRAERLRAAQQQAEEQAREALRAAQQQAEELDEAQRVARQRFQDYLDEQLLDEQLLDEHREQEFTPDAPAEDTLDKVTRPRFPPGEQLMRANLEARLREAKTTLEFQRLIEKFSKWSSRALLAGQFVLGGALTSAFVQQTLSTTLVGSLGLIVLLATIIRERFNPEASGNDAKQKIGTLSKLIRKTEDDLALYDAYQNGYAVDEGASLSLHEMLQAISNGLNQIEDS